MSMYREILDWLNTVKDEEGGVNALARRIGTDAQKLRRAIEQSSDPAASSFVGWLESMGAHIVFPDREERAMRIVKIPMAGSEIGAGSSFFYDEDEAEEARQYTFREDFINRLGCPRDKLRLFRVRGASMEPEIQSGDVLLVKFQEGIRPKDGEMLVIRIGQELLVKLVFIAPGGKYLLRSLNKDWPEIEVMPDANDFEVLGVPCWIGRQLSPAPQQKIKA